MLTISHTPIVQAVVDSWRARLPMDTDGRTPNVGEAELRELIVQLSQAVDLLTAAMDTEALLARLNGQGSNAQPLREEHR